MAEKMRTRGTITATDSYPSASLQATYHPNRNTEYYSKQKQKHHSEVVQQIPISTPKSGIVSAMNSVNVANKLGTGTTMSSRSDQKHPKNGGKPGNKPMA